MLPRKSSGTDPPFNREDFLTPDSYNKILLPLSQSISPILALPSGADYRSSYPAPSLPYCSFDSSDIILTQSWLNCQKFSHAPSFPLRITSDFIPPPPKIVKHTRTPTGKAKNKPYIPIRTKKIALKVNEHLLAYLKQAFSVTRAIYNECVWLCCKAPYPQPIDANALRKILITKESPYWYNKAIYHYHYDEIKAQRFKDYFEEVPADVRDGAIREFTDAVDIQFGLLKSGTLKHFDMHYKRKKELLQETITIRGRCFSSCEDGKLKCYSRVWKNGYFEFFSQSITAEELPKLLRVSRTKEGKFYMLLPFEQPKRPKVKKNNAVALDPGVRIFQTTYDTDGVSYLIGKDGCDKIDSLAGISARMRSGVKRYFNENGRKRFRKVTSKKEQKSLSKAANRIERKIKNMISDAHRKTVKFLCEKYDTVIIPKFGSQGMVNKTKRKIGKTTARKLLRWSHYKFRELLKTKGEITGTNIIVGTEEYTSKTCGHCMFVNQKLQGERKVKCPNCGIKMHRDINAARNILMHNWFLAQLNIRPLRSLKIVI